MLSRIADSLFWMNRYMERTDGILRVVHIHYSLSLDKDVSRNLTWKPVMELFTVMNEEEIEELEDQPELVLKKILIDTTNSNSLKVLVNKARENARGGAGLHNKRGMGTGKWNVSPGKPAICTRSFNYSPGA